MTINLSELREICAARELHGVSTVDTCKCSGIDYRFLLKARTALPQLLDWVESAKPYLQDYLRLRSEMGQSGFLVLEALLSELEP